MGTLTAWEQTGYFALLRTDLLRHGTALLAGELLARLTEELDPHPASFDAMLRLLEALGAGEPPLRRLADFARVLLTDTGLTPGLEQCVNCGSDVSPQQGVMVFSGPRSGVLCPACPPRPGESTVKISAKLRDFFIAGQPPDGKLALEITRWLTYHVQNQLGQPLRSAPALERAIAAVLADMKAKA
ncbi:MAG: DNA repair protein RecO [Phycisphaerae bacterium]|nr:DNA repair protein RecO [Phycisphaerae bacterium]